jgi:transposase-like protein
VEEFVGEHGAWGDRTTICRWVSRSALYRAVDSTGATIDCRLSTTREAPAAERFLHTALEPAHVVAPCVITVAKTPTSPPAIEAGQPPEVLSATCALRTCTYSNNIVAQEPCATNCRVRLGWGCGSCPTAWWTRQGDEERYMLQKGQLRGAAPGDVLGRNRALDQRLGLAA